MTKEERQEIQQIVSRLNLIISEAPKNATYIQGAADHGYALKLRTITADLDKLIHEPETA